MHVSIRAQVRSHLEEAKLEGLYDVLVEGLKMLKQQKVSGSAALNDKFQATGKFQMSCASRPTSTAPRNAWSCCPLLTQCRPCS